MSDYNQIGETERERTLSLNETCLCLPIDRVDLDAGIIAAQKIPGLSSQLKQREHLFAGTSVFLSDTDLSSILHQIEAIEAAVKTHTFRAESLRLLARSTSQAQLATNGVMMGYDFHITPDGPRLIEINTNAGGGFLVAALQAYSEGEQTWSAKKIAQTFVSEWRHARRSALPRRLAIIDENPTKQYLYPDMLLAQKALSEIGVETLIADPADLRIENQKLMLNGKIIDMVYNRLTDFLLTDSRNIVLHDALVTDAALVSPAPRHHALYANKRNLVLLSDRKFIRESGLSTQQKNALSRIPKTKIVSSENSAELWQNRKHLFFKPTSGFAGRATYRGSKITRRVWEEILQGEYVAQELVPPTRRSVPINPDAVSLKYDVRVYTYDGAPLLFAARIYEGQTTNFRTLGGGFAPIIFAGASTC